MRAKKKRRKKQGWTRRLGVRLNTPAPKVHTPKTVYKRKKKHPERTVRKD